MVQVNPPGLDVTVKVTSGSPPLLPAVQRTTADPSLRAEAMTPNGLSGRSAGRTAEEGTEGAPGPTPLVAVTVNV